MPITMKFALEVEEMFASGMTREEVRLAKGWGSTQGLASILSRVRDLLGRNLPGHGARGRNTRDEYLKAKEAKRIAREKRRYESMHPPGWKERDFIRCQCGLRLRRGDLCIDCPKAPGALAWLSTRRTNDGNVAGVTPEMCGSVSESKKRRLPTKRFAQG